MDLTTIFYHTDNFCNLFEKKFEITRQNKCTGASFIDSFALPVSHIKRACSHKTFASSARKGKTSTGWFYGFKVHLVINDRSEILDFVITAGNIADNNRAVIGSMTKRLQGKVYGDRGYLLNAKLFREIYNKGVHIVTKLRRNMVNKLKPLADKLILRK